MKMAKILKTENGKWSWRKIGLALLIPLTMFVVSTSYARYSWIRDQAYKVATNEKALIQTKESLLAKDKALEKQIAQLRAEMNKKSGILHVRANKETDKREKGDERLLDLILKSIKQQQDMLEQTGK